MKQAIILAAGEGRRLKPFAVSKPKAMISIADKPIVQYVIESLAENGIRDIILVVGYQKDQIFDYIGDGAELGVEVRYVSQDKQLGTGHALARVKGSTEKEFLVLSGNKLIMPETISQFVRTTPPAILIKKVDRPSRYGVISLKDGRLVKIVEKPASPQSNYVNAGVYSFDTEFMDYVESELDIPDAINNMLAQGKSMNVVETGKTWLDIVYPWDILSLNSIILEKLQPGQNGVIETGVSLNGAISIGKDTLIHSNTYITGPVIIGKGCEIGPNVCILPSTSIGDNVIISAFSEVRNSVIDDDVEINTHAAIQDSVIDKGCVIGSHFCACSEDAEVKVDEEYHKIKLGAIMGRSCQIGNMVNVQAGTIIGNYVQIKSMKSVNGEIPDRSLVV
jgi:UDP-N-acetylglucosamine diphosphorylase/glucosamine-1-phosphate N-acetyltransferase